MKFLVISRRVYFCEALNLQMKGTKSRRVIFGPHKWGVFFLLQGHYLQGLKIGIQNLIHLQKCVGSATRIPEALDTVFVARVKWMMLQSFTKTPKKRGGVIWRILGVSWIFGFSKFYKGPAFLWTPQICRRRRNTKKTGPAQHIDFKSPGDRHTIILRCFGYLSAS